MARRLAGSAAGVATIRCRAGAWISGSSVSVASLIEKR
jgi:hypothetical protein